MAAVTRSRLAGALRDRYGVDPNRDRKLVAHIWEYFERDARDGAKLDELIRHAGPLVDAYSLGSEATYSTSRAIDSGSMTDYLGGSAGVLETSLLQESGDPDSDDRAWIGRRMSAFSEYLSKILATDERVMRFRKRAIGFPTETLTVEQANRLVHSPAAAYLPFSFFEGRGVSLTDHEATTEQYEEVAEHGGARYRATVRIEPAGMTETVYSEILQQGTVELLFWPGQSSAGFAERIRVWNTSVLGELQRLGKRLSDKHPWQQDQAINFILTGTPQLAATLRAKPRMSYGYGVKAHKYNSHTITLEAAHWLPASEVARAYRKLQREAHGDREKRKPSERNTAVFRHVVSLSSVKVKSTDECLARLEIPKWRDTLRVWNMEHPAGTPWHYEDEAGKGVQRFHRDYKRGQHEVIGCDIGLPGDTAQPMTRAEQKASYKRLLERLDSLPVPAKLTQHASENR